jgi:hypothetical protein
LLRLTLAISMLLVVASCGGSGSLAEGVAEQPVDEPSQSAASTSTVSAPAPTVAVTDPGLPKYEGTIPALPLIDREDFPPLVADGLSAPTSFAETGIAAVAPTDYPATYRWDWSYTNDIGTLFTNDPNYEFLVRAIPLGGEPGNSNPDIVVSVGALAPTEQPPTAETLAGLGYAIESSLAPVELTNGDTSPIYVGQGRFGPSFAIVDGVHYIAIQVDDGCRGDDTQRSDGVENCFTWSEIQQLFDGLAVISPESLGWSR